MIITFGDIFIGTEINLKQELIPNTHIESLKNHTNIHGSSALTAIAAARTCAHVGIIGSIGKDIFADQILKTFRKEGIQTTGLSQTDHETGSLTILKFENKDTYIKNAGANLLSNNLQIPDTTMNKRTLLVLQADFDDNENEKLAERARINGAKTLLCCNSQIVKVPDYAQKCDVVISDTEEEFTCADKTIYIKALETHSQSAFAAFCGTFAACFQARTTIEVAIQYAQSAAHLSITKNGAYASLPYLGDIEEHIKHAEKEKA